MQREGEGPGQKIRCPACGARNAAGAEWCGQCLTRFVQTPPPPPPPPAPAAGPAATPPSPEVDPVAVSPSGVEDFTGSLEELLERLGGTADQPGRPGEGAGEARVLSQRGAFTATDAGVLWTCAGCGTKNPLEAESCSVCGVTLAEMVRPPGKERPQRDPGTVALISLFFPGAGHAYAGMWGEFFARAVLQVWVVGVALLAASQGGTNLVSVVFGLAAFALWVVAAHDAYREATDDRRAVLLKGRTYMWLVLALLVVLILGIVVSTLGAAPAPELPEQL